MRHQLDSPNMGTPPHTDCYNLPLRRSETGCELARIIGPPTALISETISEPPLKRRHPPQTGLRRLKGKISTPPRTFSLGVRGLKNGKSAL
ncbi:hypothetical protein AVEN_142222-1 [Araneus ventricosus]|uniref:Uncharacterized protein n=1 Tax=Araneus ventricosus TaxID=182803 RepID=A0A4Y2KLY8_ARAVE|nr:hypothetical protein AVEN_142222-1 [Araneus ventricosus]